MDKNLESPEFQADVQAACRWAMKRFGFAQSTYRDVDDLEQTVWERLIKWRPKYRGSSRCRPILFKIAKNVLISAGRKSPRRLRPDLEIDWDTVELDSFKGASGKELETVILIDECMNKLSDIQKRVFIEYRLGGRTSREVAKDLNVSATTVITRFHEAIQILEECIMG